MTIFNAINNANGPGDGNCILGEFAGNSQYNTGTCYDNTVLGWFALNALTANTFENVIIGSGSAKLIDNSNANTIIGAYSAENLINGNNNICLGYQSGSNFISGESSNICISNAGGFGDNNTIRIGTNGIGAGQQNICKIAGITTNLISDATSKYIMVIDPDTTIQSIAQQDITSPIVTIYDTPGTHMWTKNANTKYIKVYGWTAGNGGGSGRKDVNGTNGGGAGGGPGSAFFIEGPAIFFGATESVVVGAGGQGGASVTTDSTNGNPGSQGGNSSFGSMNPVADGNGSAGAGGNSVNALGGAAGTLYLSFGYWVQATLPGGAGIPGSGFPGQDIFQDSTAYGMATGGGAGAGGNNVADTGGTGGNYYALDNTTVILSGGTGGSITQNGIDGSDYAETGGITTGGTGGGGGGSHGGKGGKGGQPGGGGGGGGGGLNGSFNSGAGGDGGPGLVIVIEFR